MDEAIITVLELYHARIEKERNSFPTAAPGGRNGVSTSPMMAVGPESGQFLNILARSLTAPRILELGTSLGYSAIWLGEAARATKGQLISIDIDAEKSAYARDMCEKAGLAAQVEFRVGDARELIGTLSGHFDLVFLDLWKDQYVQCLEAFHPKLSPGALIVADNMIRPGGPALKAYAEALRALPDIETVTLPVGSGLEVSRFVPR